MTSRSDDTSRPRALRALGGIRLGHLVLAGTLLITLLAAGGIYIVVHRSHRSAASGVAGPKAPPDQPSVTLPAPQLSETATGNIFTPGHIPSFLVDAAEAKTVSFQVYDYYDNLVKSGVVDVAGGRATLTVAGLTYGYYLISVRDNVHGETSSPGQDAFAVLPPATALDEHFGLNTHLSQGEPSSLLTLLTDIGIRKVRDGPKYVSEFHSAGVSLQTTQVISPKPTGETPDATNHKGRFPTTPAAMTNDIQATIAYLESNPLATSVGVWNEANIGNVSPLNYFNYLKAFYPAVKKAFPAVTIVGGCVNATGVTSWLTTLLGLGATKYMDVFSIHPYQAPASPQGLASYVTSVESLLEKSTPGGRHLPIWVTEDGWPTQGNASVNRDTQAAYDVQMNVAAMSAGVERIYGYSGENFFLHFGLIENIKPGRGRAAHSTTRSPYGNGSPKPSYVATAAMTAQLGNATYVGRDAIATNAGASASNVRAYEFRRSTGGDVSVMWSTGANQTVGIAATGPVTLTGAMGNSYVLHPEAGYVWVTLTGNPVYVMGGSGSVTVGAAPYAISTPAVAAISSQALVALSAKPSGATFSLSGDSYAVPAGSSKAEHIPTSAVVGVQTLWAQVFDNGKAVGRIAASFDVHANTLAARSPLS